MTRPWPIELSVIVPNWNGAPYLFELLAALEADPPAVSHELIVVDNASADGSADMLAELYPEVGLIRRSGNGGFARAVNEGLHRARGRFLAVANSDLSWRRDWLGPCVAALREEPAWDFAAPLVLEYFRRDRVDSAGDTLNRRLMPLKRGHGRPAAEWAAGPPREPLLAASGSAVVFRRRFFARAGGFDEDFFMYYEDADLFWRGRLRGCRGGLVREAVVLHREGGSVRLSLAATPPPAKTRLMLRNRLFMTVKCCPLGYLLAAGPLLAAEWVRTLAIHLWRGQGGTWLRAHRDAIRDLGRVAWKRRHIQRRRHVGWVGFARGLGRE